MTKEESITMWNIEKNSADSSTLKVCSDCDLKCECTSNY